MSYQSAHLAKYYISFALKDNIRWIFLFEFSPLSPFCGQGVRLSNKKINIMSQKIFKLNSSYRNVGIWITYVTKMTAGVIVKRVSV